MLDIGWPELFIILVIALLVIGPRDLPRAMHTVGRWVRRARAVTSEFQRHFDEMARDSELEELREMKRQMSARGLKDEIDKTIDPTGEMRRDMDIRGKTALGNPKGAPVKPGNGAGTGEGEPKANGAAAPAAEAAPAEPPAGADKPAPPSAMPGSAEPKQPERAAPERSSLDRVSQ
jgi:sec-independent protein translocase protein TatB